MTSDRATYPARWRVAHVAETGSTNADLLALARTGEPAGLVLVADHQTAGRGRLGRQWEAPPGSSLLVSVLLRPGPHAALHGATQAVGLAARAACGEVAGVVPELKWPNDLVIGDRKLAGVLAEVHGAGGAVEAVVVGLGLNVNWPDPSTLPPELADRVVALNHVAGRDVDRDQLLAAFLRQLDGRVDEWEQRPEQLLADYRAALATLGRTVRVERPDGVLEGRAVDVDADGALVVEVGGEQVVVSAGDVVHLRSA